MEMRREGSEKKGVSITVGGEEFGSVWMVQRLALRPVEVGTDADDYQELNSLLIFIPYRFFSLGL